ncbi:MAG: hypothetical protein ACLFR0_00120 [Alphaproteobacteria bacterium]
MKKILAVAALSAMASQAQARCDEVFSAYGPGTDESVELAACFADVLSELPPAITEDDLFNEFKDCAAKALDVDAENLRDMDDPAFEQFLSENFHMWTFDHEMKCHSAKFQEDPTYDPASALE